MHATRSDYNAPVDPADVAGQIQRVHDRRHQGNRLVVPPVTYWQGFYATETVWFVTNTFAPILAVIEQVEHYKLGPFDGKDRTAFVIRITGNDDGEHFYRKGEVIDRISPTQLRKLDDDTAAEWAGPDHTVR